jgi:hypothetical protein
MNDNIPDPFDSDELPRPRQTTARRPPIIVLAAIAGVVLLGLIAGGVWGFAPCVIDTPERVLAAYYADLEQQDALRIASYFESPSAGQNVQAIDDIKNKAEQVLRLVIPDLKLAWKFQDLQYRTIRRATDNQCRSAVIEASARLRVYDSSSEKGVEVDYSVTHTLVRKDGRWYLQP